MNVRCHSLQINNFLITMRNVIELKELCISNHYQSIELILPKNCRFSNDDIEDFLDILGYLGLKIKSFYTDINSIFIVITTQSLFSINLLDHDSNNLGKKTRKRIKSLLLKCGVSFYDYDQVDLFKLIGQK